MIWSFDNKGKFTSTSGCKELKESIKEKAIKERNKLKCSTAQVGWETVNTTSSFLQKSHLGTIGVITTYFCKSVINGRGKKVDIISVWLDSESTLNS